MIPFDPSTVVEKFKALRGVAAKFADTPLKAEVVQLNDLVIQAQAAVMDLQQALHSAHQRTRSLEVELGALRGALAEGLTYDRGVYWASASRERDVNGPFCTLCVQRGTGRRYLQETAHGGAICDECHTGYSVWPERDGRDHDFGPF